MRVVSFLHECFRRRIYRNAQHIINCQQIDWGTVYRRADASSCCADAVPAFLFFFLILSEKKKKEIESILVDDRIYLTTLFYLFFVGSCGCCLISVESTQKDEESLVIGIGSRF